MFMLVKCKSEEKAFQIEWVFFLSRYLENLGKKRWDSRKYKKKKDVFSVEKMVQENNMDTGVLWSHEGMLKVNWFIVGPQNASNHLWMYN